MSLDDELAEFRRVLDSVPIVGHPSRAAELAELFRLINLYPDETRDYLARHDERRNA